MKKINKIAVSTLPLLCLSVLVSPRVGAAASNCTDKTQAGLQKCLQDNPIVHDLNLAVSFLSAIVGVVIVGSLIYAGIQYTLAGENAQAVGAAKQRIIKTLVALVSFISIFAFLQWIIPGGVL
jgi:hypothetical protein